MDSVSLNGLGDVTIFIESLEFGKTAAENSRALVSKVMEDSELDPVEEVDSGEIVIPELLSDTATVADDMSEISGLTRTVAVPGTDDSSSVDIVAKLSVHQIKVMVKKPPITDRIVLSLF